MNLFFINRFFHPDQSATSQLLSDLSFHLAKARFSVHVITSRMEYDDPASVLPARETIGNVVVHRVYTTRFGRRRLPGRSLDYLTFYFSATWAALRLLRRGDVLIVKTDPPLMSVPASVVARLRGARLVNWLQDLFPEVAAGLGLKLARGAFGAVLAGARDRSLRQAACNVVLGTCMAEFVEKRSVPRERINIIPNWADDAAILPVHSSENPLLGAWGLSDKFVVGYSGNLGRAHEFQTILEAAYLLQCNQRIVFLFIGGGAQLEELKNEVRVCKLPNFVFHPYQPRDKLHLSLAAADLHVVSLQANLEGLMVPSKFYGIAAAARPVAFIGRHEGEIAQVVKRHQCGMSFAIGDYRSLAKFIEGLAEDKDRARALGANARAALDRNYSQAMAFAAWEMLLNRIATGSACI